VVGRLAPAGQHVAKRFERHKCDTTEISGIKIDGVKHHMKPGVIAPDCWRGAGLAKGHATRIFHARAYRT